MGLTNLSTEMDSSTARKKASYLPRKTTSCCNRHDLEPRMETAMKKPSASGRRRQGQQQKHGTSAAICDLSTTVTNIDFISQAFCSMTEDEVPWVTGFPGDPYTVDRKLWGGRSALPLPWFIRIDYNNYIAVSSFVPNDDDWPHRRKSNFGQMHLVMVDDVGTKVDFDKLALPPSVLVETSPGNFQAWYFLNPPEDDRLRAERLIDGMVANGLTADASDPGMKGVTRYGRLPVGVNGKAKYVEKLGSPFVQRVAVWSPTTRYSIDKIAAAYGVDLSIPAKRSVTVKRRTKKAINPGIASSADGLLDELSATGLYLEPVKSLDGAHQIVCPWLHEHTDEEQSGTVYFDPGDGNNWRGGFKCHHGHCQHRTMADLQHFLARLQSLTKE